MCSHRRVAAATRAIVAPAVVCIILYARKRAHLTAARPFWLRLAWKPVVKVRLGRSEESSLEQRKSHDALLLRS